jgi:hypothetical protein
MVKNVVASQGPRGKGAFRLRSLSRFTRYQPATGKRWTILMANVFYFSSEDDHGPPNSKQGGPGAALFLGFGFVSATTHSRCTRSKSH